MNNQTLNDLKLTLTAISTQRAAFELLLDIKLAEAIQLYPDQDVKVLHKRILTSSDVQAEYQKLVTLYGCIGSQSGEYSNALTAVGA